MFTKKLTFSLAFVATTALSVCAGAAENPRPVIETLRSDAYKTALSVQLVHSSGKSIGEALFDYTNTNKGTLSSLFVNEAYRLQGYGSKLFRSVCSVLKKKGCTKLTWNACAFTRSRSEQPYELAGIVEFFEKLGARVVEYQDYVYGMPTTAVMTINL